jgi:hypothetical protein
MYGNLNEQRSLKYNLYGGVIAVDTQIGFDTLYSAYLP